MKKFLVTVLIISATQTVFADYIQELRKSAEQGNTEEQFILGMYYYIGDGKDYAEAVRWFRKAGIPQTLF